MSEWVPFKGTASKIDSGFRLTAADKNGVIELASDAVKVEGNKVEVKVGATAKIIENARGGKKPDNAPKVDGCRMTQCVAFVLICCDNGQIISGCAGFWGCQ